MLRISALTVGAVALTLLAAPAAAGESFPLAGGPVALEVPEGVEVGPADGWLEVVVAGAPEGARGRIESIALAGDDLAAAVDPRLFLASLVGRLARAADGRASRIVDRWPARAGRSGLAWRAYGVVGPGGGEPVRGLWLATVAGRRVLVASLRRPARAVLAPTVVDRFVSLVTSLAIEPPAAGEELELLEGSVGVRPPAGWTIGARRGQRVDLVAGPVEVVFEAVADRRSAEYVQPATWASIGLLLLRGWTGSDELPAVLLDDVVALDGGPAARLRAVVAREGGQPIRVGEAIVVHRAGRLAAVGLLGRPADVVAALPAFRAMAASLRVDADPTPARPPLTRTVEVVDGLRLSIPAGWTADRSAGGGQVVRTLHPTGARPSALPGGGRWFGLGVEVSAMALPHGVPDRAIPWLYEEVLRPRLGALYEEGVRSTDLVPDRLGWRAAWRTGRVGRVAGAPSDRADDIFLTLVGSHLVVVATGRPVAADPAAVAVLSSILDSFEIDDPAGSPGGPVFGGCRVEVLARAGRRRLVVDLPPGWKRIRDDAATGILLGPADQPAGQEVGWVLYQALDDQGGLGLEPRLGPLAAAFFDEVALLEPAGRPVGPIEVVDVNGERALERRFEGDWTAPDGRRHRVHRRARLLVCGTRIHRFLYFAASTEVDRSIGLGGRVVLDSFRDLSRAAPDLERTGEPPAAAAGPMAFVRTGRDGRGADVHLLDLDSGRIERLTDLAPAASAIDPAVGPGGVVAFASDHDPLGKVESRTVYRVDPADRRPVALSDPVGAGGRAGLEATARLVGIVERKDAEGRTVSPAGLLIVATGAPGVAFAGADGRFELPVAPGAGRVRAIGTGGNDEGAYTAGEGETVEVALIVDERHGAGDRSASGPTFVAGGRLLFRRLTTVRMPDGEVVGGATVWWLDPARPFETGALAVDDVRAYDRPVGHPFEDRLAVLKRGALTVARLEGDRLIDERFLDLEADRMAWSPDGRRLAFVAFVEAAGADPTDMKGVDPLEMMPTVDSRRLSVLAGRTDGRASGLVQEIHLLDLGTGSIRRLTAAAGSDEWAVDGLAFAPDGRSIVYARGGRLLRVATTGGPPAVVVADHGNRMPAAARD